MNFCVNIEAYVSHYVYSHLFPVQWKMSINLMSEMKRRGATMLTNRCLAHTYVIYKVSYAWLQLRQLA